MSENHDSNARLEMLRQTIDRNRERVLDQHEYERAATHEKERLAAGRQ